MKIITGISNTHKPEEINAYANAGVDEFFVGYVPKEWSEYFGFEISCNRREHSNYQYHSIDELENIVGHIHAAGRKVYLTLNAHEFNYEQYKLLRNMLKSIQHVDFDGFIISNIGLILQLRSDGFESPVNLSIGAGNNNVESFLFYSSVIGNINRFIFPRKFTLSEFKAITDKLKGENFDLEAFLLGDPCHFNDEYCFTWHGAANESLCNSPMYKHKAFEAIIFGNKWKQDIIKFPASKFYEDQFELQQRIEKSRARALGMQNIKPMKIDEVKKLNILQRINKCGICMVQKFKEMGINTVKLPLRGYSIETNLQVIKMVRKVADTENAGPQFCQNLLNAPSFCSGHNCYYDYPFNIKAAQS